jgi:hypothetical protein
MKKLIAGFILSLLVLIFAISLYIRRLRLGEIRIYTIGKPTAFGGVVPAGDFKK